TCHERNGSEPEICQRKSHKFAGSGERTLRPPARCPTPFSCTKVDSPSDSRASLVVLSSISGRSQVIVFPRLLVLPDLNPEANPSSATQILHSFFLALLVWAKSLKPVTTEHDIHPTHSYNRHHCAKTARRARHETKTSAERPRLQSAS